MGKIIVPGSKEDRAPTLRLWLEAFTCVQECASDAADNSEIKRDIADNIKMLRARVKENADPQAQKLLETQQVVQRQMFARRPEIYTELLKLWRDVAKDILSYDWDLQQEVVYQEEVKGGPILFWQAPDADTEVPRSQKVAVARARAVMIIRFLKFVREQAADDISPIEYTKQMLMKQGINEHNFELYADLIASPNPWKAQ